MLNAAIGRYQGKGGDEQTLLRSILDTLEPGDLLVGDAFYATYFLLCTKRSLNCKETPPVRAGFFIPERLD